MPLLSEARTKKPRYRIRDKWEPKFESELKLATLSFFADDAFHRAFGGGGRLNEKSILWHFIGLIISRRFRPEIQLVTVCKDKDLVAFLSGGLNIKAPKLVESILAWFQEILLNRVSPIKGKHAQNYQAMRDHYGAIEDEEMERRISKYFGQLRGPAEKPDKVPLCYQIHMIAVDPAERGLGHLRAMLKKLVKNLESDPQVEFILVSTYDQSKAEMYEHLGFNVVNAFDNNTTKAWVLQLPIVR